MEIKKYNKKYDYEIFSLWNTSGVKQGFTSFDETGFRKLILEHRYFSDDHAFMMMDGENLCGFICGCTGDDLPKGDERGYFTCLLLSQEFETEENSVALLCTLENSFRQKGKINVACTFFNPMNLPWIIPETNGHQHNNSPGIGVDLELYKYMLNHGYNEVARECAMHLDLNNFILPNWVLDKKNSLAQQDYTIEWYNKEEHEKLIEMVNSMENPLWNTEIPKAAENINMIVALKGNEVVGFTGPVYPEETGRGYFAGIAVSKNHEGKGLGTILFYQLCEEEKTSGAKYMSLFTGSDNHAVKIYENAGFKIKRTFSVMIKPL